MMNAKTLFLAGCAALVVSAMTFGGSLQAPPGLFKDLNDEILGDAVILNGKQLFVEDWLIDEHEGVVRSLNQPVKHPDNPLMVPEKAWEETFGFSSVMFDREEGFYKMWYGAWSEEYKKHYVCYATSADGIAWKRHITTPWNAEEHHNKVFGGMKEFNCAGVFKDPADPDGERRYKMVYSDYPPAAPSRRRRPARRGRPTAFIGCPTRAIR